MTDGGTLQGIYAAVLTPLDGYLRPDARKAIGYYRELLSEGCDGLNILGTTGEAMSVSADDRARFMGSIAMSGLPRERIMVGTGAAALRDTIQLTTAAFEAGFAAALVMPPFYFRDQSDAGILRFFDRLVGAIPPRPNRIVLYNFPRMSGMTFHPELVERLIGEFPGAIAGLKDSSNDAELQRGIREKCPGFAIFPGSEAGLTESRANGAAGCISGSVCLWPRLASEVWRNGEAASAQRLEALRTALAGPPLIAAVRYLTARARNDDAWTRTVPPLETLTETKAARLLDALSGAGYSEGT